MLDNAPSRQIDAAVGGPDAADPAGFLAELAHELRSPLGALLGMADAFVEEAFGPLPAVYRQQAGVILEAGRRLLAMIDGLPTLSSFSTAEGEAFEAGAVIESAARLMAEAARRRGIALTRGIAPCPVRGVDARLLWQIVANLLSNALRHAQATVALEAALEGADLVVRVRDDGPGFAAEGARPGALGLGLARRFCALQGGVLAIEDTGKSGACVTVRLPAAREG